jgi:cellulose biosynthesis protein BcsQ
MRHDREAATSGQIVTFYSYKGGTGRTMALANVAWILATNAKRVLVMDWDLESPGLHRYFHPFLVDKMLRHSPGVIDMIRDFAAAAVEPQADPADADWFRDYADVASVAVSLDWRFPGAGVIDLVPAGRQDGSYSRTVSTFDWPTFYDRLGGGAFLRALRDNLREYYDYVLIDSRTGLSDTASICTVLLPDTVVNCFTLSDQSIDGAAAVADSIVKQRPAEPVRLLPVPMRVEDAEQVRLEAGRDYARHRFAPFLRLRPDEADRYWGDVEIPYKPYYAYEEILSVFGDRPRLEASLLTAFERLTAALTDGEVAQMAPLDERIRRRLLTQFERPRRSAISEVLISYASEDRMWAEWIATELGQAGLRPVNYEVDSSWPGGTDGLDRVLSAVQHSLVLLSPAYCRSRAAVELWRRAVGRHAEPVLVPIRLVNRQIPPPFTDRPLAADFSNQSEQRAREALFTALDLPPPRLAEAGANAESGATAETGAAQAGAARSGPRFPATPPPVWSVPQRNAAFTGRVALLEGVRSRLAASATFTVPQALYGLDGVGKTQVALEYAHRFAADYDIVWWISAEQPSLVRASLADLAVRIGMPTAETVSENVAAVLDALRRGEPYRRWLLVFDNADQPEELAPYLPQGTGHVLLTSRNVGWVRHAAAVEVGVFTRDESVLLPYKRDGRRLGLDIDPPQV